MDLLERLNLLQVDFGAAVRPGQTTVVIGAYCQGVVSGQAMHYWAVLNQYDQAVLHAGAIVIRDVPCLCAPADPHAGQQYHVLRFGLWREGATERR